MLRQSCVYAVLSYPGINEGGIGAVWLTMVTMIVNQTQNNSSGAFASWIERSAATLPRGWRVGGRTGSFRTVVDLLWMLGHDESDLVGEHDGLDAVAEAEFGENVGDVGFDGRF